MVGMFTARRSSKHTNIFPSDLSFQWPPNTPYISPAAALDVDQIAKTVDYRALQDSIRQITYCDAGKEFDSEAADPNLVKVFRMSQLIIEYLLQSQDFLANNLANVEQRLNTTMEVGVNRLVMDSRVRS